MKHIILFLIILISFSKIYSQKLFYCSNFTGTYQVYSKDFITNEIVAITSNPDFNYWWVEPSPQGTELLLMRSPIGNEIEVMFDYETCQMLKTDINGENQIILVNYTDNIWQAFGNPHWHPTEDKIIFLAETSNQFNIYTMNTDGTNIKKMTSQFALDPNWSHGGNKIVFIGINSQPTYPPDFDDFEVFTADYSITENSISNIKQLTFDTRRDHDPCFSPDDKKIVFSSAENINLSVANLTVIDTTGSNRFDLVNDNTTNGGPVNWSSNNNIYYHNVNFHTTPFSPFTAKTFDVNTNENIDLFPSVSEEYISPYFVNNTVGKVVDNLKNTARIFVYPNPATERVYFECDDSIKKELIIFNSLGCVIEKFYFRKNYELNISKYRTGQYFYQITSGKYNSCGVFMKL